MLLENVKGQLFPDTPYGFDSGGDPAHIPELTFENYKASYARYNHPSNARFFLDGSVDMEAALAKLEAVLTAFDRIDPDAEIPTQAPVSREKTLYYEIGPEESLENKALLAKGWVYSRYDEPEKTAAFSALTSVLAGSNEAPLKKAVLDAGLCEDLSFSSDDAILQNYSYLLLRNVDPARRAEAWELVRDTLARQAAGGLDRKRLHSVLNRMEFSAREKDFGGMPKGIVFAIQSMESWLYGGDPAQPFRYTELFRSLREKVDSGWFEGFLKETLLENPHTAEVCMLPSRTLGEEKRAAERTRLAALKERWTAEEKARVIADFAELRRRQSTPDSPEQLASLPALKLSDIPEKGRFTPEEAAELDGARYLYHPLKTDGITYAELFFDCSDQPQEKLWQLSLLGKLLGEVATEHYAPLALADALEDKLGHFASTTVTFSTDAGVSTPYFAVSLSFLDGKKEDAAALLDEILNRSLFRDKDYIFNLLRQNRISLEQSIMAVGNRYAAMRAGAAFSAHNALREQMDGISFLRALQKAEKSFESEGTALLEALSALAKVVFHPGRATLSLTGERDDALAERLLGVLKGEPLGPRADYRPSTLAREGFVIPAEVGFSAKCGKLDVKYSGAVEAACQYLSYDYLWNTVRVQGGAYGTGCGIGRRSDLAVTSFRDPSPAQSLETFDGCGAALAELSRHPEEIGKFAVSAVSSIEPVETPRTASVAAVSRTLCGITEADQQKRRSELLHTTASDLAALAESLNRTAETEGKTAVCVIGGKNVMDSCRLDRVAPLQ